MLLSITGCKTVERQKGGDIKIGGKFGSAEVHQPENAKEEAKLNYHEDGVDIPMKKGDTLDVFITENPSGGKKKEIKYRPVNDANVFITDIIANGDTGYSHKDMAIQLDIFMKHTKVVMWIAVALMAGGLVWTLIFKDLKTGGIIGAAGGTMMVAYSVLPSIYSNGALIAAVVLVGLPVLWYLDKQKNERIVFASQKAYEKHKAVDEDSAKKHSSVFKEHLKPSDIEYLKKMKNKILT